MSHKYPEQSQKAREFQWMIMDALNMRSNRFAWFDIPEILQKPIYTLKNYHVQAWHDFKNRYEKVTQKKLDKKLEDWSYF